MHSGLTNLAQRLVYFGGILLAVLSGGVPAFAACTAPAGVEGQFIYNSDHKVMQFCDNTDWIAMGDGEGGGGGISDGDKGDIVVSGGGSVWTVKPSVLALAAGSTGQVQFNGGANALAADGALFWDNTNKRLGIGTATPQFGLDVAGTILGSQDNATQGTLSFATRYSGQNLINTYGSQYSSGATAIGYAVRAKAGSNGYVSSADNVTWPRGVVEFTDRFVFKNAASATVARGSDVTLTDRLVVASNGNVGIGVSVPQSLLHIRHTSPVLIIEDGDHTSASVARSGWVSFRDSTGAEYGWVGDGGVTHNQFLLFGGSHKTGIANTNGKVIVSENGLVGIGTDTPEDALHVEFDVSGGMRINANKSGAAPSLATYVHLNSNMDYRGRGMYLSSTAQETGSAWFMGVPYTGGGFQIGSSSLSGPNDADSSAYKANARIYIKHNGNVGIGTSNPQVMLQLSGSLGFTYSDGLTYSGIRRNNYWVEYYNQTTSTTSADIHVFTGNGGTQKLVIKESGALYIAGEAYKPGGGAWVATSDARLKNISGAYEAGLEEIKALSPVRFTYKPGNARHEPADRTFVGLVAQDVQAVIPEAVSTRDDGYLDLDSTPITYAYINAIKTLSAQNEALREELDMLKARLDALEAR